jgi:DNA/RNA endonuclease YhcR with UshA esterase domain
MNNISLSFLAIIFSLFTYAQKEIKLEEVKDHVGDSITVKGKIYGIKYFENAKNQPTLINVGAAYPNQLLTIVIYGDVRKKLTYDLSEKKYSQGMAVVTGKVELYKDKPQIVVTDLSQFNILIDEEVPKSQIPPIRH